MPSPALDRLKQAVSTTVTTALTVGSRAYRAVRPAVATTAPDPHPLAPHDDAGAAGASADGTTTRPSRPGSDDVPDRVPDRAPEPEAAHVNPASVAKNIAHQRPIVVPVADVAPDPEGSPGGKLPPRR